MPRDLQQQQIWIGLAHVVRTADDSVLPPDAGGAYLHVLALASDLEHFQTAVKAVCDAQRGVRLYELDDMETLLSRLARATPSKTILAAADQVEATGELRFDAAWFTYPLDERPDNA